MEKDKLIKNLKKFTQKFQVYENEIIIKSDFNMNIHVNFENEKIEIKAELTGWNFLTGFKHMKLVTAIIYTFIGTLLIIPVLLFASGIWENLFTILIFIFSTTWVIGFISFYNVKSENMKTRIINWIKE